MFQNLTQCLGFVMQLSLWISWWYQEWENCQDYCFYLVTKRRKPFSSRANIEKFGLSQFMKSLCKKILVIFFFFNTLKKDNFKWWSVSFFLYFSGCPPGASFPPRGRLAMSRGIFGCHHLGKGGGGRCSWHLVARSQGCY